MIQLSERKVGIRLSEKRDDPVIKRGWLESSYQRGGLIRLSERRVGIQLSERRVGIQLSREEGWDPVIREEV